MLPVLYRSSDIAITAILKLSDVYCRATVRKSNYAHTTIFLSHIDLGGCIFCQSPIQSALILPQRMKREIRAGLSLPRLKPRKTGIPVKTIEKMIATTGKTHVKIAAKVKVLAKTNVIANKTAAKIVTMDRCGTFLRARIDWVS
jgi:hypothetical protein